MAEARNAFRTLVKEAPEKLQLRIQQLLDSLVFKDELSSTKTELEAGQADQGSYVHIASADTITAKHTFAPASATAPFTLGSNALAQLVTGLNADYLDSQHGSYYQNASNINAGTLAVSYGGTGLNTLATGRIPYGAGTSAFGSSATLVYASSSLGVGTAGPDRTLDVLHASDPQVRLTQADGTVYVDLKADSSGNLNILPSGTTVTIGAGTAGIDYILQFNGETTDGVVTWMEDEDYLKFSDDILMDSTENIYFRDTAISINSANDGHLDLTADVSIDLNTATDTDLVLNFAGTTNSGVLTWMEDEDYFQFSDVIKSAGRLRAVATKTADYVTTAADEVIVCNKATAMTITLLAASGSGRIQTVANINTGAVTIDGNSSDTIAGATTQKLYQWESMTLCDYASNAWVII